MSNVIKATFASGTSIEQKIDVTNSEHNIKIK